MDDLLWGPDDTVTAAVRRGRTYILVLSNTTLLTLQINSLVANIMRFSLGPAMLKPQPDRDVGRDIIPTYQVPDETTSLLARPQPRIRVVDAIKSIPFKIFKTVKSVWNPPLTGALLAVLIGLIPPVKREFYHEEGFFYGTITTSLTNIGELFTALMLFILGANLQIKSQGGSSTPILVLVYIYFMRFILMPLIAITVVWKVSDWGWLDDNAHEGLGGDPMMKFIMCLIPSGPSAIVLANIADLAGVEQGAVGKLLILSYVVSPTIAFTVAGALRMITGLS